jgi:hypothetical protein
MTLLKLIQKRAAPTSPKSPAIPKADAEEPTAAALDLVGVLLPLLEVREGDWLPVADVVALAEPEEALAVAEPDPDPLSLMAVLMQLVLVPAMILTWAENAVAPLLSLRAQLKLVLAGRSTSQVKELPVCSGNSLIC